MSGEKKRPLDDYDASIPSIQEIDHQGEYGAEPPLYNVPLGPDMVDELLEYPVELCSINNFVYDKLWTKPAYDLLLDKVQKLNKDWQEKTIDTIDHQDNDFTNLNAQDCAIVSNKYTGANFAKAKFTRAKVHGGEFKNCQFESNSFNSAEIGQAKFDNCTFTNVEFGRTDIKNVEFKNCTFSKCSFPSTQFHTSDFYDCNILECIFNSEMWYKGNISNTKISKSQFNKSQFSGILIDSVTLVDSSLLKATFFASQIQNSDFSNNAWLKVGFASGNSIYKSTLYNENIQQCNFSDSEWMANEVQNSQTLRNDFSAVEMHDSDFVGLKGAGDNFATGVLANCKFMDCDFAQANFTATDFIVNSSIQNCILEKLIYAYAVLPKDFDENQLKKVSQAEIKQLSDHDLGQEQFTFNIYIKDKFNAQASFEFENSLTAKSRKNLDFIVKNKINPLDVITTQEAIEETNDSLRDSNGAPYIFTAATFGKNMAVDAYTRRAKVAQEAANAYLNLNNKLFELKGTAQKYSGSLKKNFQQVAGYELNEFEKSFNKVKELGIIDKDRVYKYGQYRTEIHQNRFNSEYVNIYVGSAEDASKLSKIIGLTKVIARGSLLYDITVGAYQISQAENKQKETAKVAGAIGGGMIGAATAGILIGIAITPAGWVGLGAYAIVSVIGGAIGSDIGEKGGDWLYENI
ncbi:pentapeptide repeat-containing protein [Francisella philomiragia]|uniref:pentapeptide repeat-containing protein n=1 Tax=Francisella philomiragia TaxID=28110 RepID=UPI001C9D8EC1|nr:pentapeptide repeat-containing protein [Francisella philomiragia]MBY7733449.1 pentapeptide repeat-containing protein [Francisella philomiragia]